MSKNQQWQTLECMPKAFLDSKSAWAALMEHEDAHFHQFVLLSATFLLSQELLMAFGIPLRPIQSAVSGVPVLTLPAGLQYSHMIGLIMGRFSGSRTVMYFNFSTDSFKIK